MSKEQRLAGVACIVLLGAALVVVTLPAVVGAGDEDQQATCADQERQILTALQAYLADNDGKAPPVAYFTGTPGEPGLREWGWHDLILKYLNDPAIYTCPAWSGPTGARTSKVTYGMYWCEYRCKGVLNYAEIADPEKKWAVMETLPGYDRVTQCWHEPYDASKPADCNAGDPICETYCTPEGWTQTRHNGGMNVGFWDGHVEWVSRQIYDPAAGNQWWDF